MIEFDQVTRSFGQKVAVDNLCLTVNEGELFALIGRNGAGKTTTIKMIVGLLRPEKGAVRVRGLDTSKAAEKANQSIGYVPDEPQLYDKLTGREFLHFVARMYGMDDREIALATEQQIQQFELESFVDQLTESYSHGMKQRTVFAAVFIHSPPVLVIDEPLVGLDPHSMRLVKDLLKKQAVAGVTIFISTHTLSAAEELADRIGVMHDGRLLFDGTLDELRDCAGVPQGSLEDLYLALVDQAEEGERMSNVEIRMTT